MLKLTEETKYLKYVSQLFKPTTSNKQANVVVLQSNTGVSVTINQKITYDFINTPTVTNVGPSVLSVLGMILSFIELINKIYLLAPSLTFNIESKLKKNKVERL